MAISVTPQRTPARAMVSVIVVALDEAYPEGGYLLTARDFGFTELSGVICQKVRSGEQHLGAVWDPDTEKLLVFYPTGGTGPVSTSPADPTLDSVTDLVMAETKMQQEPYASMGRAPGVELDLELEGSGLVIDTSTDLSPGGGKECIEGTDLSAVTVRVMGIGY